MEPPHTVSKLLILVGVPKTGKLRDDEIQRTAIHFRTVIPSEARNLLLVEFEKQQIPRAKDGRSE